MASSFPTVLLCVSVVDRAQLYMISAENAECEHDIHMNIVLLLTMHTFYT